MQLLEAAEDVEASEAEQGRGNRERQDAAPVGEHLPRETQLVVGKGFASADLAQRGAP